MTSRTKITQGDQDETHPRDEARAERQALPSVAAKPKRFLKAQKTLRESFDETEKRSAATLDYLATN